MPNITTNYTIQYNRNLQNVAVNKPDNLSLKEAVFENILTGIKNQLQLGESGKKLIGVCLDLHNGEPAKDEEPYQALIKELSKNVNSYFGTKVFPRGFQKLLAVGYIYDNPHQAFDNNGSFNYSHFKSWIETEFGANVSNNLNKKYYQHITFDTKQNSIKLGNSEYKNELKDDVITECIQGCKKLNKIPGKVAEFCLKDKLGDFKSKVLELYNQNNLIEDREYLQKFKNKYKEEYKELWKNNYFMLDPEDVGRKTLNQFVAKIENRVIDNRVNHTAFVKEYPPERLLKIAEGKPKEFDEFLQRESIKDNEFRHMQLFAEGYIKYQEENKFKSFFFDKEYGKYINDCKKAFGLGGVGADQLYEMIEFYLSNSENVKEMGDIFDKLGINADNYEERLPKLDPGFMYFAVQYFNIAAENKAKQNQFLPLNRESIGITNNNRSVFEKRYSVTNYLNMGDSLLRKDIIEEDIDTNELNRNSNEYIEPDIQFKQRPNIVEGLKKSYSSDNEDDEDLWLEQDLNGNIKKVKDLTVAGLNLEKIKNDNDSEIDEQIDQEPYDYEYEFTNKKSTHANTLGKSPLGNTMLNNSFIDFSDTMDDPFIQRIKIEYEEVIGVINGYASVTVNIQDDLPFYRLRNRSDQYITKLTSMKKSEETSLLIEQLRDFNKKFPEFLREFNSYHKKTEE